jgi:hypothetical protein
MTFGQNGVANWGVQPYGNFVGNNGQNLMGTNGGVGQPNASNQLAGFNPNANFNMQQALSTGAMN